MNRAYLLLAATCCVGCAAAEDLVTINLGAGDLQTVKIEQSLKIGDTPQIPSCIPIPITLSQANASAELEPVADGCALTLSQTDLVIVDQKEVENARKKAGPFDIDGITGAHVELLKLNLLNEDGSTLPLAQYVDAVTVQVDNQVVVNKIAASALQNDTPKADLPDSLVDKLKSAVKANHPATAAVKITFWLDGAKLLQLPTALSVSAVIQPELDVNVIKAL
jgi:hypothetical protein